MPTKIVTKNQILTSLGGIYYIEDEYTRLFGSARFLKNLQTGT